MSMKDMRPGNGWNHLSGPVYEHVSGTRIHILGMVKLPNGEWKSANKYPENIDAHRLIRINGENRKRGIMAWANQLNKVATDSQKVLAD